MQGRSQQVGRGLQTIASRLVSNADLLKKYGVEVKKENGELYSTYEILKQLKPAWDKMGDAEKVTLGKTLAGVNQYKVLASVLSAFDVAVEANTDALNAQGTTMKQNEVYMESMEAKLTQLASETQKLILGDGGLEKLGKTILDIGINILKFANSDVGQVIIKTALLTGGVVLLSKAFNALIVKGLITWFNGLLIAIDTNTTAMGMFNAVLNGLNINPVVLGLTALVAVAVSAKAIYDHFNVTLEEHENKLQEISSEYKEAKSKFEDAESKLKDIRQRIEEIQKLGTLSLTDQQELNNLILEETTLQSIYTIEKNRANLAKEAYVKEAEEILKSKVTTPYSSDTSKRSAELRWDWKRPFISSSSELGEVFLYVEDVEKDSLPNAVNRSIDEMIKQQKIINSTEEEYLKLQKIIDGDGKKDARDVSRYKELKRIRQEAKEAYDEANVFTNEYIGKLKDIITNAPTDSEVYSIAKDIIDKYAEAIDSSIKETEEENYTTSAFEPDYNTIKESYDEELKLLKHYLNMGYITQEDYYREFNKLTNKYLKQNLETQVYFNDLIWENEEEIYKGMLSLYKNYASEKESLIKDEISSVKTEKSEILNTLKEEQSAYKKAYSKMIDLIRDKKKENIKSVKEQIAKLEELEGAETTEIKNLKKRVEILSKLRDIEDVQNEIDYLKELKETSEKFWEEKIEAFEAQNKALDEQNKLMEYQESLAKAKSQKVLVLGANGFEYTQDENAIANAQKDLEDYQAELEYNKELEGLKKSKEEASEYYEQKIDSLTKYKETVSNQYETLVDLLDKLKEETDERYDKDIDDTEDFYDKKITDLEDFLDKVEEESEAFINNQEKTVKAENDNFQASLDNLDNYIEQYKTKIAQLRTLEEESPKTVTNSNGGNNKHSFANKEELTPRYAFGTSFIDKDQLALVGDNPNYRELVIGSKLNNDMGVITALKGGSGVVNSDSTKTLAGILNSLGGQHNVSSNSNMVGGNSITIGSINLPQVHNPSDFVSYLKNNFANDIAQGVFAR